MLSSHEIYSRYTESRSRTREGKERKRNWGNWKKENKNYGERASAVITSAALNGGISQCLWHNFMGFTMAYIRGPAERISPRGIHICPTVTFVPLLLVLYFHPFDYSNFAFLYRLSFAEFSVDVTLILLLWFYLLCVRSFSDISG